MSVSAVRDKANATQRLKMREMRRSSLVEVEEDKRVLVWGFVCPVCRLVDELTTVREAGGAGEQVEEGQDGTGGRRWRGNGRQVQVEVVQGAGAGQPRPRRRCEIDDREGDKWTVSVR